MAAPHLLAQKSPTIQGAGNLDRAIERLRLASDSPGKNAFTARVLNAVSRLVTEGDERLLTAAAGAPSDYDVLIQVLEQPDALAALEAGPLAPARLRGLRARERMLNAEGGTATAEEVARILQITRQAVDKRRRNGKLIGLSIGRRGYAYPVWQFAPEGGTLPGLEDVLADLRDHDPLMQAAFMLNPNLRLDERTALQALREGDLQQVQRAAKAYGEHGLA